MQLVMVRWCAILESLTHALLFVADCSACRKRVAVASSPAATCYHRSVWCLLYAACATSLQLRSTFSRKFWSQKQSHLVLSGENFKNSAALCAFAGYDGGAVYVVIGGIGSVNTSITLTACNMSANSACEFICLHVFCCRCL